MLPLFQFKDPIANSNNGTNIVVHICFQLTVLWNFFGQDFTSGVIMHSLDKIRVWMELDSSSSMRSSKGGRAEGCRVNGRTQKSKGEQEWYLHNNDSMIFFQMKRWTDLRASDDVGRHQNSLTYPKNSWGFSHAQLSHQVPLRCVCSTHAPPQTQTNPMDSRCLQERLQPRLPCFVLHV